MPGFFVSLRNRVQSVFMTPRQRARAAPPAHRARAMWLERQVTVDSTSVGSYQAFATRSGRVPDAGRSLRERRVRGDASPGVGSYRPPHPILSTGRQSAGENAGQVPGSRVEGLPTTEHATRAPSPQATAAGTTDTPAQRRGLQGLSGHQLVLRQELYRKLFEARRQGYVREVFVPDRVGYAAIHSDNAFLEIVKYFTEGMRDLHARFPGLKNVEPPALSQQDPNHDANLLAEGGPNHKPELILAKYEENQATMMFANPADVDFFRTPDADEHDYSPTDQGFDGSLAHEYGHHLSSDRVVSPSIWKPKLEAMLRANGLLVGPRGAHPSHANDHRFAVLAGKQVRELGIGEYAGSDEYEFVAEAIGWRMHPGYGRAEDAPRMPPILENWVHECFPFLDNGRIPQDSVPFNPGSIKEPVSVNGTVKWKRRDVVFPD